MPDIYAAIARLKNVAADDRYGYSQARRAEPFEDDCSSMSLDALRDYGKFPISKAATYTGNSYLPLKAAGFVDITHLIDKATGRGLTDGDVCLRPPTKTRGGHMAVMVSPTELAQAAGDFDNKRGDSSGREIRIQPYYNGNFKYFLRYPTAKTFQAGDIVLLEGECSSSSTGSTRIFMRGPRKAKIIKVLTGRVPYPYAVNYTVGNWIDAWTSREALR